MPYKSELQKRFFNWKAQKDPKFKEMATEYNAASEGMKLPEKAPKKIKTIKKGITHA